MVPRVSQYPVSKLSFGAGFLFALKKEKYGTKVETGFENQRNGRTY